MYRYIHTTIVVYSLSCPWNHWKISCILLKGYKIWNSCFSLYLGGSKWAKKWKSRKYDTPFQNYSVSNEGLYTVSFNNSFDY